MFSNRIWKKGLCLLLLLPLSLLLIPVFAGSYFNQANSDTLPISNDILDETYLSSNQFTQPDDLSLVSNFLDVPDSYLLMGENEFYSLYMEETSYAIRVVNKVDGFIYGSSLSTYDGNLENFNTTWEGIVNSAVTIKYYSYNETTGAYTSVEESLLKSSLSVSSYEQVTNGFLVHMTFGESGISLSLKVYLDGSYLQVEVPNDSITEGDTYKLRSIKVYPFFGAVYGNTIPGYIFVPDGSGALIRYQDIDVLSDIYEFRYYGSDDSITNSLMNEPILSFPVSGLIQGINQHGFISIVEDGAPFASLVVSPAKNNLKYYYTYNEFLYRSLYQTPLSLSQAESSGGRMVIQDTINSCSIALKYQFLSGDDANYVGMASKYQEYLLENSFVNDTVNDDSVSKVFLEVIGSEMKRGFITNQKEILTDILSLSNILQELSQDIPAMKVVYKGFTSGGVTSAGLIYSSLDKALGSRSELIQIIQTAASLNIDLYFYLDTMKISSESSFNMYKDIALRINQSLLMERGFTKDIYYVTPNRVKTAYLESIKKLISNDISMFAVGTVGNKLYSDYQDLQDTIDRSNAMSIYQSMFEEESNPVLLYQPNLYLLKYTDAYLMMPLTSSRYRIYSDTVPFASYVLSSVMEKYASFQNFSSASKIELLKMVDYQVFPSYIVTQESAYNLQDTELMQIYSSTYSTWKESILSDYLFVSYALNYVNNAKVILRVVVSTGVYEVTYDNSVKIIINYTNSEQLVHGVSVPGLSYQVVTSDA
ncbi:MAG: DUF5696 domain-containing protein [Candidatus Izemoplasmatales bacterium]|nr:DUF5696 domain-containing protein [Candidatus Izemoplasmatales bacterium]